MIFTTADGVDLFYEFNREPRAANRELVLLNGIMMTTRSWIPLISAMPDHHFLLHDFRGQLRSPYRAPMNIEEHADDLVRLFDHLEIDRAHVAGTSYGGEVGMIFAYTYPERVQSLTVIASTSRADEHQRARTFAAMNVAMAERDRLYDVVARDFFSAGFLAAHPEVVEEGRARLATYDDDFFAGYISLCDAFSALDITDNLRAIQCPTLVIAGEQDMLKPASCSETIAANIPDARLETIDAGHAVVIERPDEVARLLLPFLGSIVRSPKLQGGNT